MSYVDIADKTTLDATKQQADAIKSVVDATKTKTDSTKSVVDSTKTVVDETKAVADSTKTKVDQIYDYITETDEVFGFIEHNDIMSSSGRIEYIGKNKNYTPMALNKSTGVMALNSWAGFTVLESNKPWMVKSDGTADYRLNENDYTKKIDGSASDVANTSYDGGAFAWVQKIYKKQWMSGDKRHVLFSMTKREGFSADGFIDTDGNELEGVWIPMFYGSIQDSKMRSLSGLQPSYNTTTASEKSAIDAVGSRAKFFGGSIVQTITDLLIMFAKNTNSQEAYGYGNSNGYNSSASPTYGVLPNAVVAGGQFYGTSDAKRLNKIMHSVVLGTYQQYMRDPYTLFINGEFYVSTNYTYDLTGAKYKRTGIKGINGGWHYPKKYVAIPGFGTLPEAPYGGSSSTGGCDGLYTNTSGVRVALRFGNCNGGLSGGLRCLSVNADAGGSDWDVCASVLLLPPAGAAA